MDFSQNTKQRKKQSVKSTESHNHTNSHKDQIQGAVAGVPLYLKRLPNTGTQPNLKLSSPSDPYEQEADRVADHIMRMPEPKVQRQEMEDEEELAPYEEGEGLTTEPAEPTPILESVPTRDAGELGEEEPIQTKKFSNASFQVTPNVASDIRSLKGFGQSIPVTDRTFMEPRFGKDFGSVRIHTGHRASRAAQLINARAFTHGSDIVFGAGQYAPGNSIFRKLLAHELAHVVQQNRFKDLPTIQRQKRTATKRIVRYSSLSSLKRVLERKGKGALFDRLRYLKNKDHKIFTFLVKHLHGDDQWLAVNLFRYGPEQRWPIHLRVDLEMKTWGGGKEKVFNILRSAKRWELKSRKLTSVLRRVFGPRSEDIWYARALQIHGPEKKWSKSVRYQSYLRRAMSILEHVRFGRQIRVTQPRFDKRYWSLRKYGGNLILKSGKKPADAVRAMFSRRGKFPIDRWSIDCAELVQVAHWYALLMTLGSSQFNRKVKGMRFVLIPHRAPGIQQRKIFDRHRKYSPVYTKIAGKVVKLRGDADRVMDQAIAKAPVGSRVMWTNELTSYSRYMWTNENAIKLDSKWFGAHGMKGRIHTRQEIELHMSKKYYETFLSWSEKKIQKNMGKIKEYAKKHIYVAEVEYYKTP